MLLPLSCCTTRGKNPGVAGELPAEHDGSITVIAHSELGKAYSEDLRERVFAGAGDGTRGGRDCHDTAGQACRMNRRFWTAAGAPARPRLARKLSAEAEARSVVISGWVKQHPDATIGEVQVWLLQTYHVSASSGLTSALLSGSASAMVEPFYDCWKTYPSGKATTFC
jgi:hypothetical protein